MLSCFRVSSSVQRGILAAVIVALSLVLIVSCTGGDQVGPIKYLEYSGATTAVLDRDPHTGMTFPLAAPKQYEVPDIISGEYVGLVVHGFDHMYGDLIRMYKGNPKAVTKNANWNTRLGSMTTPAAYRAERKYFSAEVTEKDLGSKLRDIPGDPVSNVVRVAQASRSCVVVHLVVDMRAVYARGVAQPITFEQVLVLTANKRVSSSGFNPTPWVVSYRGIGKEKAPKNVCR